MRVLLAAKHSPEGWPIGGVQSWCRTVAAELCRVGHDVETWGAKTKAATNPPPSGQYDLGIVANVESIRTVLPLCERVLVVSHGIIRDERPPEGMRAVYTSEGVRARWRGDGPVIRQPIDLDYWSPDGRERSGLVWYSYRRGLEWLGDVARNLGMPYRHLRDVTHDQAREVLRGARCVLATGRAALEAAACGASVVICDNRLYQGTLAATFGAPQMPHNYSGRGGVVPTPRIVTRLVEAAIAAGDMREHVREHHDVRAIVPQLLEAAT